ncbi:MAG: DUF4393 domain-containing protein [Mucilaginibacter sp.]|uniref:DUF4393 domain-containing protein n=1 Tax=Mucilaginibacter sp. TaxID=1882438 RepID=UPI0032668CEB
MEYRKGCRIIIPLNGAKNISIIERDFLFLNMEQQSKDSNIKSTIEAVASLVKAVPVYEDALQPAAKQIGGALETITKAVNAALAPVKVLVWGYEQIERWLVETVTKKLSNTPAENISAPAPNVVVPAIEALRYMGQEEELRALYANLIAAAMDSDTKVEAHPAYVEILKNLSSEEAKLLQSFSLQAAYPAIDVKGLAGDGTYILYKRCYNHLNRILNAEKGKLLPTYIDNLVRLGILETPLGVELSDQMAYVPLEVDAELNDLLAMITDQGREVRFVRLTIRLTVFGAQFIRQVVRSK